MTITTASVFLPAVGDTIGQKGLQLFIDVGQPVNNNLVNALVREVIAEKVGSMLGRRREADSADAGSMAVKSKAAGAAGSTSADVMVDEELQLGRVREFLCWSSVSPALHKGMLFFDSPFKGDTRQKCKLARKGSDVWIVSSAGFVGLVCQYLCLTNRNTFVALTLGFEGTAMLDCSISMKSRIISKNYLFFSVKS